MSYKGKSLDKESNREEKSSVSNKKPYFKIVSYKEFSYSYSSTVVWENVKVIIKITNMPHNDDYKHLNEPKARRCPWSFLTGAEQNLS
jgi:hypothetical protein